MQSLSSYKDFGPAFVRAVLETYGLYCEQGLHALQMAVRRAYRTYGNNLDSDIIVEYFETTINGFSITAPRPIEGEPPGLEIAPPAPTKRPGPMSARTPGLPLGVEAKDMKVLGTKIPGRVLIPVLKRMFNGEPFKSRELCPLIEDELETHGIVDFPQELPYHIACRLSSSNKTLLRKDGVTYSYK